MEGYVQVLTTVDAEEAGVHLASGILEARLAACVQIVGPIRSSYWWENEIEVMQEWLLLIKTTAGHFLQLEEYIKAHHSYDTPEITMTPITGGSAEYLGWISEETGRAGVS